MAKRESAPSCAAQAVTWLPVDALRPNPRNPRKHGQEVLQLARTILRYRYSVVYFSLKAAWQCLPFEDELARIKRKSTERQRALLGRNVYAGVKPELTARAHSKAK